MSDIGTFFPPRDEWDVAGYPSDDVVDGYRQHRVSDPPPGPNWPPGYRWGWINRHKDETGISDGFEHIRSAFIKLERGMS